LKIKNLGIDEGLFNRISEVAQHMPFYNLLGIRITALGPGYAELMVSTGADHANNLDIVHVEDEYINENNQHYIVTKVSGSEGIAEIKTQVPQAPGPDSKGDTIFSNNIYEKSLPAVAKPQNIHVVIYHTHSDESYIPTSGTASEPGKGDVLDIGKALQSALQKEGISVTHSDKLHDPHDINAYHRSRRTAAQLIKEQPDAVFDIHRDSAPARAYQTSINGVDSARIMIVIGRSNPNMQTNLQYAKRIKAAADELYPGLMRGIFMGKGDYNQDLYPTSILAKK
jgi:stage II sporulation protein P